MITEILLFVLLLGLIIILMDVLPIFKDWVSRIHIGRYPNEEVWKKAITAKGVKWLNNTPKIKVTDNTRLTIIDRLRGNYSKNTIQHWQEASLLLGLQESLKNNEDKEVKEEILKFLNKKFDSEGQWVKKPIHVDAAILAYAVMKIDFIDTAKYQKAFDFIWQLIQEHIGRDGTVGYRKSMMDYRYVDTIGFICPFLVAYGTRYQKVECIDLAIKQIREFTKYGMLDEHYIPCHAYDIHRHLPLGLYGWGRGSGWFALGIMDTWNELPNNDKNKNELKSVIKTFAKSVKEFQNEDGSWNWTITRSETRSDSSATAILGWFLYCTSNNWEIQKECTLCTNKALNYLMRNTRRDGAIDFSQGDTKDIGVYSNLFNVLPFTQGISIRINSLLIDKD